MRPCCQPPRDTPILGAGGAPYDPFLLAAHLGVPVNEVDLNGIDGYVESHGNNYCVFLSSRGSRVRRRFTLSHELAHVIFMQTARRGESEIRTSYDIGGMGFRSPTFKMREKSDCAMHLLKNFFFRPRP